MPVTFGVIRDGYIKASDLQKVLSDVFDARDEQMEEEFAKRDAEIASLRREIETERRLRLAMRR